MEALESEWSFGIVNDVDKRKICYNELFRRAASRSDYFVFLYADDFNAWSALKYERQANNGSILANRGTKENWME